MAKFKFYPQTTNAYTTCDTTATNLDMSATQGSTTTQVSDSINDTAFNDALVFDLPPVTLPAYTSFAPSTSVDLNDVAGGDSETRWYVELVNAGTCSATYTFGPSSAYSSTGIKTDSYTPGIIAGADYIIRLRIQVRRIGGHGGKTVTLNVQDADTWVELPKFVEVVNETEGISEGTLNPLGKLQISGETEGITETTVSKRVLQPKVVNESGLIEEPFGLGVLYRKGFVKFRNETEGITETVVDALASAGTAYVKLANDTEALTEQVTRLMAMVELVGEAEGITESTVAAAAYKRVVDEVEGLTEQVNRLRAHVEAISETEDITETAPHRMAQVRTTDETEDISEATLRVIGFVKLADDVENLAEAVQRVLGGIREANDTEGITEAIVKVAGFLRVVDETESIAETVVRSALAYVAEVSETVGISSSEIVKLMSSPVGLATTAAYGFRQVVEASYPISTEQYLGVEQVPTAAVDDGDIWAPSPEFPTTVYTDSGHAVNPTTWLGLDAPEPSYTPLVLAVETAYEEVTVPQPSWAGNSVRQPVDELYEPPVDGGIILPGVGIDIDGFFGCLNGEPCMIDDPYETDDNYLRGNPLSNPPTGAWSIRHLVALPSARDRIKRGVFRAALEGTTTNKGTKCRLSTMKVASQAGYVFGQEIYNQDIVGQNVYELAFNYNPAVVPSSDTHLYIYVTGRHAYPTIIGEVAQAVNVHALDINFILNPIWQSDSTSWSPDVDGDGN